MNSEDFEYKIRGTGAPLEKFVLETYRFEEYKVVVKLTSDRRFVGIEEVRINKDFRPKTHKIAQEAFSDIDNYIPEEQTRE